MRDLKTLAFSTLLSLLVCASIGRTALGANYVAPVTTIRMGERVYSTTLALRNASPAALHVAIGREQRALGLFDRKKLQAMTAAENIELNMLAMRRAGVPEDVIQMLQREALKHAASLP